MERQFDQLILQLLNEKKKTGSGKITETEYYDIPLDDEQIEVKYTVVENKPALINDEMIIKKRSDNEDYTVYCCNICSYVCKNINSLSKHRSLHRGQTACQYCGKVYASKSNMELHIKNIHTKEFKFTCEECGYKSNTKDNFEKHLRVHTGEKPFQCELCEFRTKDQSSLISHRRTHEKLTGKTYTCNLCGKTFDRIANLRRHKGVAHVDGKNLPTEMNNQVPKCSLCDQSFMNLKLLSKHKNEDHLKLGKEDFPKTQFCDICNKNFSSRQSYRHHNITIHTKIYPVTCESCGKGFTGTGLGETLEKHQQYCLNKLNL